MAFVSEVAYKETRNADGSLFSQQMEARIILKEGELPYPLDEQEQADAVVLREGGLLIEFVRRNLDVPFKRGDELAKNPAPGPTTNAASPMQDLKTTPQPPTPPPAPKEQAKPDKAPESIPEENAYKATDKQLIAIGKWRITERYDRIAAEYLAKHKKAKAGELTITEASELLTTFGEEKTRGVKA